MRLPKIDSATFRSLVTGVQVLVGSLAVLLLDPNFKLLVTEFVPSAVPEIAIGAAVCSLILNVLRKGVANY